MNSAVGASSRNGVTIIEVMTVLFVIGIIVSLFLPGVVSARSAARSIQCKNNLHNLGIATHNLQSSTGFFPRSAYLPDSSSYPFSYFVELLPYLEKADVFARLNFHQLPNSPSNAIVTRTAGLSILHCPEQSTLSPEETSYWGNGGTGLNSNLEKRQDGFLVLEGASPGDFPAGLSNIVAMSECASLNAPTPKNRGAIFVKGDGPHSLGEWESHLNRCRSIDPARIPIDARRANVGSWWTFGGNLRTIYWHTLPPGENSCAWSGKGGTQVGTANSSHSDGVQVLFGDGSVKMQTRSIDLTIWHDQGCRFR